MAHNSTSDSRVGWISSGSGRSTTDIIGSCLSIFLVCTWSCLHLNVPSIEESEAGWHKWHLIPYWPQQPLRWKWGRMIGWMVWVIIAPEFGIAMATIDFLSVKAALDKDDEKTENRQTFSKSHAFLANMGGFKVMIRQRNTQPQTPDGFELGIGEAKTPKSAGMQTDAKADIIWEGFVHDFDDLVYYRSICQDFHMIDEEDIQALSKSDSFKKLFAIIQSTWLVVQCIARASVGLPITQLELATIAFVVCGIIMYALWWNKPYGIERRQLLLGTTDQKPTPPCLPAPYDNVSIYNTTKLSPSEQYKMSSERAKEPGLFDVFNIDDIKKTFRILLKSRPLPLPMFYDAGPLAFYLSGTLFAAFHLLAWNWEFPSPQVRLAWRIFAVIAASANPILMVVNVLANLYENVIMQCVAVAIAYPLTCAYVLARFGLIVLIFYCFSSMPMGVYQTVEWTKMVPHFG